MPHLLFRLRNVPDDEADEVRALLESRGIAFYETSGGLWGTSTPGIWLDEEQELERARALLEQYQRERYATRRAEYERLKNEGRARTWLDIVHENPVRFALYVAIVLAVLYFSIKPFLEFGR